MKVKVKVQGMVLSKDQFIDSKDQFTDSKGMLSIFMNDVTAKRLTDILIPGRTPEEVRNFYDKWSTDYDKDLESVGWNAPRYTAEGLSKLMTDRHARILDCAAGTGLVGQELNRYGYRDIEAIDISQILLNQAAEKCVYKKLICAKLGADQIEGIKEDTYDAIVCAGGFLDGHLDDTCFTEFVRILRKDGLICIAVRAKALFRVEGPILNSLLERKILEEVEKYQLENVLQQEVGYFVAYRVL
ncbi:methyltransferase-like protein 27 [Glandiceps talaboti]